MAAITHIRSAAPTTNATTYTDTAFTPSAGVLLIVAAVASGTVANADLTSSSGLTFTRVATATKNGGADTIYLFVANALTTGAEEQLTFDCTGDGATGAIRMTGQISGMTKTGSAAVRQFKALSNQAGGGTPAITFDSAALTTNPTLGVLGNADNPFAVTPPTDWTELNNREYATPDTGGHYVGRDSGFTGTTITWGSTSATAFGGLIVEFDASAGALEGTLSATLGAATLSATAILSISGALSATLGAATLSAAGTLAITGALSATLAPATLSATANLAIEGSLSATLASATVDATGTIDAAPEPEPEPEQAAVRGGDPVPGDRKPRRIKRETIEKRGKTLKELFDARATSTAPAEPPLPDGPPPAVVLQAVSRETIAPDYTPLIDGLESLQSAVAAAALAQAVEEDDFEVLAVAL